jgi:Uri superfamily endonuclease
MTGTGVYALVLTLPADTTIDVGRLGTVHFPAGWYLYAGSALGPGGLPARLARHRRMQKKCHWHIDYLRAFAAIEAIWWYVTSERLECRWAAAGLLFPGATVPAPRFGSSDCSCPTHLVHLPAGPDPAVFARVAEVPPSGMGVTLYGQRA